MIGLPRDGGGQRLLRAGGADGRGGEAILGIDPVDRRGLGAFGGNDHVGSDDRHLAGAFDRRTDRDPALSWGDIDAICRTAGPLGHAGRAADGGGGGGDAGADEIADQEVGEIALADGGELPHAARCEPPFQAAVGAEVAVAATDAGQQDDLTPHRFHGAEGRKHGGHVAIGRDPRQIRHRWGNRERNGGRAWRGASDCGCGGGKGRYGAGRAGRGGRRRGLVVDEEVFARGIDPRQAAFGAARHDEQDRDACPRACRTFHPRAIHGPFLGPKVAGTLRVPSARSV